jgi:POT family proton-dependent oligopeptide transporter
MNPNSDVAALETPGTLVQAAGPIRRFFTSHPIGFWFIFWGELAERCSYYGMRAILVRYMAEQLGLGDEVAAMGNSYFIAACYLLCLVGGYVADNYFGKFWTIVGFSLPYILGHVILGIESIPFLIIALSFLAMGSGVIKPNISTLMGMTYDQQRPGMERLRSDAFAMFYGAINVGAAISSFAMPEIRDRYGYRIAFLFPAALMVLAFFLFAFGKRFYAVEIISRKRKTPEERQQQWVVLARIIGLFIVISFFWSIFEQGSSTWVFFARDHLDLNFYEIHQFPPDQIQSFNPVLIILFLPPVTLFWHALSRRGLHLRPTDKMMIGFFLTAVTMGLMSAAGFLAESGKVSLWWEFIAYACITVAEICISVVGLELAFTAAPNNMKSFVTGCWWLTVTAGNMLNAQVTPWYSDPRISPGQYFGLLTLMMIAVMVVFFFVARRFNRQAVTWQSETD